jgi:LCP family protein required for cell wall assembly
VLDLSTKRRPRRGILILRWSVLGLVVLLLATGGYVWYSYQHFVSGISHIGAIAQPSTGSDQNILLVGDDHRPANASPQELAQLGTTQDGGSLQTDTMMVLHIPANGSKATVISFPRDSWVSIPGFGMNKLNAAFEFGTRNGGGDTGGAKLLMTTIQNMSGLTINHFVRVSLLGFYDIAQALGPIQVCLNNAVNDPYSTLNLPAGVSTLDAQQALAFVRQRHGLPRGDLDREVRQQYFLSVEARKFLSAGTLLNPVKLQNALTAVSSSLQTDPGFNFLSLAAQLHGLSANNLTFATIPVSGTPTISVNGTPVSIVQVDTAAMPGFIASVLGTSSASPSPTTSAYAKATPAPVSSVRVTALNGSAQNGLAAQSTAALAAAGFKTGAPGTTTTHAKTTIEYPAGMESGAKALAAYVPGAVVVASSSVSGVTLILGTDGLTVTHPGAATSGSTGSAPAPTPTSPATSFGAATCIN